MSKLAEITLNLADIPPSGTMLLEWFDSRLLYAPAHVEPLDLEEKRESLLKHGFLTPLVLSKRGVLVDGYRRLIAAKAAGLTAAPYSVNASIDTPAREFATIFATEGARCGRNPAAHALTLKEFMEREGITTQKEVAKQTGISEATLSRLFALLSYQLPILEAIGAGKLKQAHVMAVHGLDDMNRKVELLNLAMATGKTAKELEKLAFPPARKKAQPKHWTAEENGVSVTVGMGVSQESFNAIMASLLAKVAARFKQLDKAQLPVAGIMQS